MAAGGDADEGCDDDSCKTCDYSHELCLVIEREKERVNRNRNTKIEREEKCQESIDRLKGKTEEKDKVGA